MFTTVLADVMALAGLTHGGFYRHFDSKDHLVAEACAAGMDSVVQAVEVAAGQGEGRRAVEAIVENYLSTRHRDDHSCGCPLAGLGSEIARADSETRAVASEGIVKLVDAIAQKIRRRRPEAARSDATFMLAAMIGAVTMARMVTDPDLSASILQDTKKHLVNA